MCSPVTALPRRWHRRPRGLAGWGSMELKLDVHPAQASGNDPTVVAVDPVVTMAGRTEGIW